MHYCLALFTKELPSKLEIDRIMRKYDSEEVYKDEENIVYPQFTYDWYEIGGRYAGQIKLKVDEDNKEYKWKYIIREPRNGRLFWSYLLNELENFSKKSFMYKEEDYFSTMGYRDGYILVDGAQISDILNMDEIECFTFIEHDGKAYSRSWWNGSDFVENEDFEEKFDLVKEKSKDMFLTIIDYHD